MWALLGANFLKYLGGFSLVLILLIVLASMIGGITYDTSDRSWGGWDFSIQFHFGDTIRNLKEMIQERRQSGPLFLRKSDPPEYEFKEPPRKPFLFNGDRLRLFKGFPFFNLRERVRPVDT